MLNMDIVPLPIFFAITIMLVVGSVEVGRLLGNLVHRRSSDEKESTVNTFVGTILGLVAFILAFTFGMVTDRYDERKALVREEANAIGTAYLRADFLPELAKGRTKELLHEYLDSRLEVVQRRDMGQVKNYWKILIAYRESFGIPQWKSPLRTQTQTSLRSISSL